jgi:hypothetical protein
MTISSDSTPKELSPSTIGSWFKYCKSEHKFLTLISLGAFWDFRNEDSKPKKDHIKLIDKRIDYFYENIDKVECDGYRLKLGEDKYFWVANKYYALRYHEGDFKTGLTMKQIARVDRLQTLVEARGLNP